jgi:hypothetical protein
MAHNALGLVIELVSPAKVAGEPHGSMRQIVLFDGTVLERLTTNTARRRHWRAAHYGEGNTAALDVTAPDSWLGRWIRDHETTGFEVYGTPFLVEANEAELAEIKAGNMPRALALRIGKARTEVGAVRDPWTGE